MFYHTRIINIPKILNIIMQNQYQKVILKEKMTLIRNYYQRKLNMLIILT